MKETGILFTPDNHRLILSGNKTQTRRVVDWHRVRIDGERCEAANELGYPTIDPDGITRVSWTPECLKHIDCPYGIAGDSLYVKEGIIRHTSIPQLVGYYMDGCRVTEPWMMRRTAMFMPKWAARTWLEITEVRVERLQSISKSDAIAEGISVFPLQSEDDPSAWYQSAPGVNQARSVQESYAKLWDSINKKKHPWSSNPWVWVIAFKRVQR